MLDSYDKEFFTVIAITLGCVVLAMAAIMGPVLYFQHKREVQHKLYLEKHGCQVKWKLGTGGYVMCGKYCTRPEIATIYECADGLRVEVD